MLRTTVFKFLIYALVIFSLACSNENTSQNAPANKEPIINSSKDTITPEKVIDEQGSKKEIPKVSILKLSGFFWGNYKKENKQLLNCGKKIKGLWRDSLPGFQYNYCLFNGAANKNVRSNELAAGSMLVQFTVWMTGKKIGFYSDSVNEKLIAIHCNYRDPLLKGFNIVGESTKEVEKIFGKPDIKSLEEYFYFRDDETFYISIRNFTVREFSWTMNETKKRM